LRKPVSISAERFRMSDTEQKEKFEMNANRNSQIQV